MMWKADGRLLFGRMSLICFQVRNWKAKAREREYWRKVVGEAMSRKRAEAPWKKKKKKQAKEKNITMYE
jgi:hypothetical protein